ncbi:tetratricopeptide repeat protein [bacterium]|nr:tetratricopeptide repeat protein [bacterium]MBQ9246013.1 tetratricopeptide repeat protein [bacterium]MBQ9246884.1 tetratricopeptide repeat protein [bacterium]
MKKVISLVSILVVAVFSTACINNLAVQDLNNKAKAYADKRDYTQAIERLKSSIDLDPSVFETHYNLAIVYTQAEDYINAVEEYKKVIEMKPNNADSYYSLATAENNLAVDMEQGRVRMNEDDSLYSPKPEDINFDEKLKLSDKENHLIEELYNSAIENYQKYLELNPNAKDKADVEAQIEKISGRNDKIEE